MRVRGRVIGVLGFTRDLGRRATQSSAGRAGSLRVIAIVIGLVASIALARLGGPEVRGTASALMAANLLGFALINLDLAQQSLKVGRDRGTQDHAFARLRMSWILYLVVGVPLGLVVLSVSEFAGWVILGSVSLTLSMHAGVIRNGMSGPVALAWSAIGQQSALGLGTAILHFLGLLTQHSVHMVVVSGYVVAFLIAWRPWRRPIAQPRTEPRVRLSKLVRAGIPWQPLRLGQLVLNRLDTLFVFGSLGAASAGVYSVGLSLSALILVIPTQVSQNTLYLAAQNRTYSWRSSAIQAAVVAVACALPLVLVGRPALTFFYGAEYADAYLVLLLSLPGLVAMSVVQVVTNHLRLTGGWRRPTVAISVSAACMFVSLALLTPRWGVAGAAAASSIAAAVAAVALVIAAGSETRIVAGANQADVDPSGPGVRVSGPRE